MHFIFSLLVFLVNPFSKSNSEITKTHTHSLWVLAPPHSLIGVKFLWRKSEVRFIGANFPKRYTFDFNSVACHAGLPCLSLNGVLKWACNCICKYTTLLSMTDSLFYSLSEFTHLKFFLPPPSPPTHSDFIFRAFVLNPLICFRRWESNERKLSQCVSVCEYLWVLRAIASS